MNKPTYIAFCLLAGMWLANAGHAQLVEVFTEVFYADDGTVNGYPEGAVTSRIYASLQDSEDALSAVFASDNDELSITTTEGQGIWNTAFGGITGPDLNAAFFAAFPETRYDSMVTIGRESNDSPGGAVSTVASMPSSTVFQETFGAAETGWVGDFALSDGTWFSTPDQVNTWGQGEDNRVLLAQITTDGLLGYKLNIQILDGGVGGSSLQYVWNPDAVDTGQNDGSELGLDYQQEAVETN